jgi:hypothetical protein
VPAGPKVHLNIGRGIPACGCHRRRSSWSCVITSTKAKAFVTCGRCRSLAEFLKPEN